MMNLVLRIMALLFIIGVLVLIAAFFITIYKYAPKGSVKNVLKFPFIWLKERIHR